jgi:hypothetical protein
LKRTGQLGKLWFGLIVCMAGGLLVVAGWNGAYAKYVIWPYALGACMTMAGLAWNCIAITCPACGAHLFWKALSERSIPQWYVWLTSLKSCPSCGK